MSLFKEKTIPQGSYRIIKIGKDAIFEALYEYIIESCEKEGYPVQTGEFGADMKVELLNDGPFTIVLDNL